MDQLLPQLKPIPMKERLSILFVNYGSMNPQLSERTGFNNEDAELIKSVLPKLFEGDAS